jgi:hypothetical protein
MIAKMAGYAFRLRSLSFGGQVGSNPPTSCDALADLMKAIDGKTRGLPAAARKGPEQE